MPLTVLLVEDNALNRELATDLLEAAGHRVFTAVDGAQFRAILKQQLDPDIVLMDIRLPDANGLDLLQELRASPFAAVPVVAITAHALSGDRERLCAAGFFSVLTKPIDTRSFLTQVETLATKRSH